MGVVMISLAMVGSAGYYYLAKASREMASMYTNNLLPVKWLNDNRNQSRALDADMFDLMMTTDKIKKVRIKNDITERTKLFDQNLANYEKTRLDSSELDTLKSLHDNLQVYYANRDEVINLAMQDKAADAYKLFNTTVRGSINSMHINLKDLAEYSASMAQEIYEHNQKDFSRAVLLFSIIIIGALIAIGITGWIIMRSVTIPLRESVVHLQEMTRGNFSADASLSGVQSRSEFGALSRAFADMGEKIRTLIGQISSSSEMMARASEDLTSTSQTLSEGAQTQAASIEETSSAVIEMSGSGEEINRSAREQADLAKATFESMKELKSDNETVAQYASQALSTARQSTEQATMGRALMGDTINGMNIIDESTKKISETVQMISDISDKVNLLALNASIEAARAGEYGRGFAVVAEEISKLADQTAVSAKTITDLVSKGLLEVKKGREYLDSTSGAFNRIIDFIAQTDDLVKKITDSTEKQSLTSRVVLDDTRKVMEMTESISSSMHEQMVTNNEMAKTMDQINQNTQTSAGMAIEIASSAERINSQAEALRNQIKFFKV